MVSWKTNMQGLLIVFGYFLCASKVVAQFQVGCKDQANWCSSYAAWCNYTLVSSRCKKTCKACPSNAKACVDLKCAHRCVPSSNLTSATCKCFPGYELGGDKRSCSDIDECLSSPCSNSSNCQNLPGHYACASCLPKDGFFPYHKRTDCCRLTQGSQCGQSVNNGPVRIVGGNDSLIGSWPWMAYVKVKRNLCGGTLISSNWVVSAAHCFASVTGGDLSVLSVVFGFLSTNNPSSVHQQTFNVSKMIVHPSYNSLRNDIALLQLKGSVTISTYVRPVCLPNGEKPRNGDKCYATGYGTTAFRGRQTDKLQEVDLPIVDGITCNNSLAGFFVINQTTMICAGYAKGGKDACQGDSGGPLLCQRRSSCDWYIAGITSFGKGCASPGVYGAWTNVEFFESWVSEKTGIPIYKSHRENNTAAEWTEWTQWTTCSLTCGGGTTQRSRTCNGGEAGTAGCAGSDSDSKACNSLDCPSWGNWTEWSSCTKSCGGGNETRRRSCVNGNPGDAGCDRGSATETRSCNKQDCPKWGEWGTWTSCSKTCGSGNRTARRLCINGPGCDGLTTKSVSCNTKNCPVWREWSAWTSCNVTCGGGMQTASRSCANGNAGQAGCEGGAYKYRDCANQACRLTAEWSKWTACSKTCGIGQQTRSKGEAVKTKTCNTNTCPSWGEWSPTGSCSRSCGKGKITRSRTCLNGQIGQEGCVGSATDEKDCNMHACPQWSDWSVWTSCSKSCGGGNRSADRTCLHGSVGQAGCTGVAQKTEKCNKAPCPSWGEWTTWGECNATCGGGKQISRRQCMNGDVGQDGCDGQVTKMRICNTAECPEWSKWTACSKTCGIGQQTRSKGEAVKTKTCNTNICPSWGEWRATGACSRSCGKGKIARSRTCLNGQIGQEGCVGSATDEKDCNTSPCPSWGEWTAWGECNATCGRGKQISRRKCMNGDVGQDGCNGQVTKMRICNTAECPVFSEWSSWSECSSTCDAGQRFRTRICSQPGSCLPDVHGTVTNATQECQLSVCPKWGSWTQFSECSVTCGNGTKTRTRTCIGSGTCQGKSSESEPCNTGKCSTAGDPCTRLRNKIDNATCGTYANYGYCNGLYKQYMDMNCKAACCKRRNNRNTNQTCKDSETPANCNLYNTYGLCPHNVFVRNVCRKTCKVCNS